jgi:polysaccharide biosynthesis/export protein
MTPNWRLRYLCYLLALTIFFSSCVNTKKATYFNELGNTHIKAPDALVPIIHKNDLLSVNRQTKVYH